MSVQDFGAGIFKGNEPLFLVSFIKLIIMFTRLRAWELAYMFWRKKYISSKYQDKSRAIDISAKLVVIKRFLTVLFFDYFYAPGF
jgi:hypothetical protein